MKYSLGLDIGVTSIGWAVIDEGNERIHDLGVRIFERAENPQNGKSLAKPRRDARSARRRLHRRRQRLNALKRFFVSRNLLDEETIARLLNTPNNPYLLRTKGLDEKLTHAELFVALYHIAKRRGYQSNRKSLEVKDDEGRKVLSEITANEMLLKARNYRTPGEALLKDEKYKVHKRNKRDDYANSFARADFLVEMREILAAQQRFGLSLTDKDIAELLNARELRQLPNGSKIELYYGSFAQRPFMNRALMQEMIGKCNLEPDEPRAPRASYSFELFRFAQELVNIVLDTKDGRCSLTPKEIERAVIKAHETRSITYKTLRNTLNFPSGTEFVYIRGKNRDETNPFGEMKFYHDVKKALAGMAEWQQFVNDPYLLDEIGLVLTVEKSDEDIRRELGKLVLPTPISQMAVKALLLLSYAKFAYFSEKALRKLTPYVLQGQTHDKAVVSAGYSFNQVLHSTNCKLPPLSPEDAGLITNPVVKRAVSQTIKVINAIVRLHGLPYQIKVECARELAKNFKERGDIKKRQDENQVKNQQIAELLKEHGIVTPTGQQIVKYKLYTQQNGQCLYSGIPISLERLLSDEAVYEIDHIVPFSRCGDDGFGNKALVTREENQQKRNAIPYEVFGNNPEKWAAFKARVESLNLGSYKTRRCLAERVAEKDWSAHALKDTQYITRFLKEYIEKNLAFSDSSKKQRVLLPAGNITSYIGKRWGLSKDREQNVLHHARDAALVAVMTQGLIQRVSAYNKYGEIMQYHNTTKMLKDVLDFETGEILDEQKHEELKKRAFDHTKSTERHFPRPWDRFDEELKRRTRDISTEDLQNELRGFESYDDSFRLQIKPIFVSRMPNRKASGSAHEETRRSPKADEAGMRTVRVPLSKVQLKDLEKSPLKDTDQQLYKVLYERLKAYEDKPEKAFAEPVYKKDKHGNNAHQVRAIKIASKHPNSSGIYIDKGRAFVDNGSMVRLDVYRKENKKGRLEHFFVPVYTHQVSGSLPTKIMPSPKGFSDVDETFTKVASLYPNDYVRIHFENKTEEGYYAKYNVSSGVMSTINHAAPGKDRASLKETSPRSAVSIERHDIPILGNIF